MTKPLIKATWLENGKTATITAKSTPKLQSLYEQAAHNRHMPPIGTAPITGTQWMAWRTAKDTAATYLMFEAWQDALEDVTYVNEDGTEFTGEDDTSEDPTPTTA